MANCTEAQTGGQIALSPGNSCTSPPAPAGRHHALGLDAGNRRRPRRAVRLLGALILSGLRVGGSQAPGPQGPGALSLQLDRSAGENVQISCACAMARGLFALP